MLNELIELSSGFQSSVNISYDLKNDEKIQNFIPTTSSLELISNILMSVRPESTQRAKILTGAYGRGKSHIILVALSMLYRSGKKKIFTNLLNRMKDYDEDLYKIASNHLQSKTKLLPVIIGGSSSSLTQAFMNALQQALSSNNLEDIMPDTHFQAAENTILKWKETYPDTYKTFTERISSKIDVFLNDLKEHNAKAYREFISVYPDLTAGSTFNPFVGFDVAEIYEQVSIALKDKGFDGLFVVYDEFGKYLESSISTATESDTKLLQDFAEKCNRSGKHQMHIMLICHKDISNYIDMNLPQDKVDGWRGISGRFEHINLHNNYSQMYEIISAVIEKNPVLWDKFCAQHDATFDNLGKRYSDNKLIHTDKDIAKKTVISCYPLHPSTTYILPRLSEKVAQNERTLFTFLSANHKNTLVEFVEKCDKDFALITPDYLYDYFEAQFRKELNSTEIYKTYQLASNVLKKVKRGSLQSKIIKTIALIYIIEQFEKLPPTVDNIVDIFIDTVDDPKVITEALTDLVDNACIIYLKRSNNYLKLKESSGVDVKEQIKNRIEKLHLTTTTKEILNKLALDSYLYPVKYNDEHCITRYFEFKFVDCNEINKGSYETTDPDANGIVQAVFFETASEQAAFDVNSIETANNRIVTIVPKQFVDITAFAYEYEAVKQLKEECKEDELLSDEYDVYLEDLDIIVHNFINSFTHPELDEVDYYHMGNKKKLYRKAQLSALLSEICEQTYPHTPIINNESINKNILPTVAVNSRTKLTTALLESDTIEENLGLTGTGQDVSIMRSTLIQTGIFTETEGVYSLNLYPNDERIKNVLDIIMSFFRQTSTNGETSFSELYHTLISPESGIGLKRGVIPIYIAVVLNTVKKDIVIRYKNEEVKINSDLLNSINEKPAEYSVVMEDWDEDKSIYLQSLETTFSEFIVEREKSYNSFTYIAYAMNRWYMSLPRCAKEMTVFYDTNKKLPKEYTKYINALKQPTNNTREFLIIQLPKIFKQDNVTLAIADSIKSAKIAFESGKSRLTKKAIEETKRIFAGASSASLTSLLKDWYDTLKTQTLQYQFPNNENAIISLISSVTNDETTFISRLAKAVVGLRLDDWNSASVEKFSMSLSEFKKDVDNYNSENHDNDKKNKSSCTFTFVNDSGEETTRIIEKTEYSGRAKLLYNDISSAIEEMGQSISEQEKRQILIEILEGLCK